MADIFYIMVVIFSTCVAVKSIKFTSHPHDLKVVVGDNVTIPCSYDQEPSVYKSWTVKSTGSLVFFKTQRATTDDRLSLLGDQYSLMINSVKTEDEGVYTCALSSGSSPIKQDHKLTVNIPASLTASPVGSIEVKPGDAFTLLCEPSGKPYPNVTWHRLGDSSFRAPDSQTLVFPSIKKDEGGQYVCVVSNGVLEPARHTFDVSVQYPPTIQMPPVVHTGPGDDPNMECEVMASPKPFITWSYGGPSLENDAKTSIAETNISQGLYLSVLTLTSVTAAQFGNYTCSASNKKGTDTGNLELTGLPDRIRIISEHYSLFSNEYFLEWSLITFSPLVDYRLMFRSAAVQNISESNWTITSVPPEAGQHGPNVPPEAGQQGPKHQQIFPIKDLQPETTYEVTLKALNKFGWGDSVLFRFTTAEAGATRPPFEATTQPEEDKTVDDTDPTETSTSSKVTKPVAIPTKPDTKDKVFGNSAVSNSDKQILKIIIAMLLVLATVL